MPLASYAFTKQEGAYSRDSFLAGRINISYNKDVGIGKSRDEFPEQGFCSRIAVGLKHHDSPSAPGLSHRSKSRPDLGRMMTFVCRLAGIAFVCHDTLSRRGFWQADHSFLNGR